MRNVFFTSHANNKIGRVVPDLFVFLKKFGTFLLIYLGRPQLRHIIKINFITIQVVDAERYAPF